MRAQLLQIAALGVLLAASFLYEAAAQSSVTLQPIRDNTLYEEAGDKSNGTGIHLFAGQTRQGDLRRALLAFDVAGNVPGGATIDSVQLTLTLSRTISEAQPVALHRVLMDWGEGSSDADAEEGGGADATEGDATWSYAFYDTEMWQNTGGDFAEEASATLQVDDEGSYTWGSTAQMVADVQQWLDQPEENFGWIVIGNEDATMTAKRFDSREHSDEAVRPVLQVFYAASTAAEEEELPSAFRLMGNHPNPFVQATTITYELRVPAQISLEVYDTYGRLVQTLAQGWQPAGVHRQRWAVRDDQGDAPASGLYLYRLRVGAQEQTGTMVRIQ